MKKLLLAAVCFVLGAGLSFILHRTYAPRNTAHSQSQAVVAVARRDISSSVMATGIIKPMVGAEVRVGSRVSGVVRRLHASIGDVVTEGQLLAELDDRELKAKRAQATAALDMAEAEVNFTRLDLERKQRLADEEMIADDEFELAEKAYRLAQLKVSEAEANLEYALTQLAYSKIHAPISGVVASVSTQEGETVTASFSTPTFLTIIDLDRLELWAYVDETDIGRIAEGQRARFTVDTYPEDEFEGRVISIYPNAVIQNTVVNYITIVQIGDRMGKILRPEMTTNVTILLETREHVLAVPRGAIRREQGEYVVYVQNEDGIIARRVQVGWRDERYTEILSGLVEGEQILSEAP